MRSFVLLINIPTLLWLTLQPYRQWHFLLCVWGRKCLCPRWAVYYFGRQHLVQHQHQHEMAVHLDPMHEHVADIVRAKQLSIFSFFASEFFWFWNSQNMFHNSTEGLHTKEHVSGENNFGVCECAQIWLVTCVVVVCVFVRFAILLKCFFFAVSVLINLIIFCLFG